MIQEINFKGLSLTPDDHHTVPGELSLCANAELHNGALRPSVINATEITNQLKYEGKVYKLLYVHKTSSFTHYIGLYDAQYETRRIKWFQENGQYGGPIYSEIDTFAEVYSISAVGNTLVILMSTGKHYALWKNGSYTYLGDHLPEIFLSFGLQAHPRLHGTENPYSFAVEFYGVSQEDFEGQEWSEDNQTLITNQIMGKLNKFIYDEGTSKNRFVMPFFVRYALRLYDGTLTMHSAPVLMTPCIKDNPVVYYTELTGSGGDVNHAYVNMMLMAADLDYQFLTNRSDELSEIERWSDIVTGIEIFVSSPIYTFDVNKRIKRCNSLDSFRNNYFIGKIPSETSSTIQEDHILADGWSDVIDADYYAQWQLFNIFEMFFYPYRTSTHTFTGNTFELPLYESDEFREKLTGNSNFFKLSSIKLSELDNTRKKVDVEDKCLEFLTAKEQMTDDYLSHDRLNGKTSYVYNSRLDIAGASRELFEGFAMPALVCYSNRRYSLTITDTDPDVETPPITLEPITHLRDKYCIYVYVKENGEDKMVTCGSSLYDPYLQDFLSDLTDQGLSKENWACWFFYPNPAAYKMTIVSLGADIEHPQAHTNEKFDIELTPHTLLNGAYALLDFNVTREKSGYDTQSRDPHTETVPVPNKLYTSEVNNPFYFPLENIQTVGVGTILGFSNITKALSPGQRGKFSLLVFSTDGVWALEVSSTGTLQPPSLITNDVCINPGSICQLSQRVLFATKRGIFQIVSEDSASISSILDGPVFKASELPHLVTQLQAQDDGHLLYNYTYTTADTPPVTVVFTVYQGDSGWIDVDTDEPVTPPEGITPTITPLIDETYSDLYSLMNLSEHPFDFFADAKLLYDFANARVLIIKDDATTPQALVYSLTDGAWSTMYAGEILSAVSGTPYPYAQKPDGTLLLLDNNYNYADASRVNSLVITRSLSYSSTMQVIQSFHQIEDSPKANTPLLMLYGSNDNVHWNYIGRSQRRYSPYLPGHPYRYFRAAIFGQMAPGENYSKLLLDVIEKYQKL